GQVNGEELKQWLETIHHRLIDENISQQWSYYIPQIEEVHSWESYDPEKREALTWEQYLNGTYPEEVIKFVQENEHVHPNDIKPDQSEDPNFKNYVIMLRRATKRWK